MRLNQRALQSRDFTSRGMAGGIAVDQHRPPRAGHPLHRHALVNLRQIIRHHGLPPPHQIRLHPTLHRAAGKLTPCALTAHYPSCA
ncbi:hypothetical protein BVG79_02144 [Ketogulonicigenium robustum]|uniref:Uncharacterized protein n=1 Tax=Ketogulonicigenium robustum TaxID=92947 RepID=A0A1W6P228_9RHOB|nr:hypothetical protein BVG79_02144 [Ketogulonicigenium robustum]